MSETTELTPVSEGLFSNLSARERILVLTFVLLVVLGGVYYYLGKVVSERDLAVERIDTLTEILKEIKAAEPAFIRTKATKDAYEKLLTNNNLDLGKIMEKRAQEQGISIEDFKEKRKVLGDSDYGDKNKKVLVAYTQQVRLKTTGLKELVAFLTALENERVPVRVTDIDIRPSTQDRQELRSIRLSVTTYKKELDQ